MTCKHVTTRRCSRFTRLPVPNLVFVPTGYSIQTVDGSTLANGVVCACKSAVDATANAKMAMHFTANRVTEITSVVWSCGLPWPQLAKMSLFLIEGAKSSLNQRGVRGEDNSAEKCAIIVNPCISAPRALGTAHCTSTGP